MAEFLIFTVMLGLALILSLVGILTSKAEVFIILGGVMFLILFAQLIADPSIIVGYYTDGTTITHNISAQELTGIGVLSASLMLYGGYRQLK